jgi:hypothetical protein
MSAAVGRRSALLTAAGATLGALGVAGAGDAPEPDGALIRLCAAFDTLERQCAAFDRTGTMPILDEDAREEARAPFQEQQHALLDLICEARATTLPGFLARAGTLALYAPDLLRNASRDTYVDSRLVGALLRDLVAAAATDAGAGGAS